ncbi:MAG: GH92 family glycosyl hydrolase [Flavobacteriales bacterium]|nr:GH92 family glycosyl hydrolase [Flavobacteriales bacterium]
MRYLVITIAALLLAACGSNTPKSKSIKVKEAKQLLTPYDLVNPFVGTGGHGHTFPGATAPFGMVQLSPDTRLDGWDGCSGYHDSDSLIYGFSHTHLSGTGVSDYGDVLLTPFTGHPLSYSEAINRKTAPSHFSKSTEQAHPGYYKVTLDDHNIDVELTATTRSGMHRYVNKSGENLRVLLDLRHRDQLIDYQIELVGDHAIRGKRISKAWASEQHIYFYISFSTPFQQIELAKRKEENDIETIEDQFAQLDFGSIDTLLVKVGISAVDEEGAYNNLGSENTTWDFESTLAEVKSLWEKELSKIEVKGNSEEKRSIFYTALYHTMIAPNTFSDQDGRYRGVDMKIHQDTVNTTFTVFSLWDTFRAAHPLQTIIDQKRTNEYINTFLKHYDQGGQLPVWELAGNYTGCMIGYHATPVILDAYVKGIRGWDEKKALEAMIASSNADKLGLPFYRSKGYMDMGDEPESVSKQLEYSYDDWCIAEMAKSVDEPISEPEYYEPTRSFEYYSRAQHYKNIFDPETGFMRGRNNGMFQFPFDPTEVNFCFTEANSWQYSMFVPQDISGMISLYGGPNKFEKKLDELFETSSDMGGRHQSDITGLIGQYAHGNEPSHHMAYLYNYIGKPWKSAERLAQIMNEMYSNEPDGLSGNEDCGQMSAWYVLSAMGFYSVTPGTDYYAIGHPIFDTVNIHLENGNLFQITTNRDSHNAFAVKACQLNGHNYKKSYLSHQHIMKGGVLHFELSHEPSQVFGTNDGDMPVTKITENNLIPVPYFVADNYSFTDSLLIEVKRVQSIQGELQLIVNGKFMNYQKPFWIHETSTISAFIFVSPNFESATIEGVFRKRDKNVKITKVTAFANEYSAGGDQALIDGIQGGNDYKTGFWQGVQGPDYEVIIDLGEVRRVDELEIGCFQDIKSWIWFPKEIEIYASTDGIKFDHAYTIKTKFPEDKYGSFRRSFMGTVYKAARYIKVIAKNRGKCPKWHLGNGNDTWIFMDEIEIK